MVLVWLLGSVVAHADCTGETTRDAIVRDLSAGTAALRQLDESAFVAAGTRLERGLLCIKTPIPTAVYATTYRYVGAAHFLMGEQDVASRWFRTALELDPLFEWDLNDLGEQHPLRLAFEDARFVAQVLPTPVEGADRLVAPDGAAFLLDGRPWRDPAATLDRPHLLQLVEGGEVTQSWLMESNEFPSDYLMTDKDYLRRTMSPEQIEAERKRQKELSKNTVGTVEGEGSIELAEIRRVRPVMKTPMLVIGAAGIVGSGVFYGLSASSRGQFDDAHTTADVQALRDRTNTEVLLAGGSLVVGAGLGYVGFALSGEPGFVWYGRF